MVKVIVGFVNVVVGDVVMYVIDGVVVFFVVSWNEVVKKIGDVVGDFDIEYKCCDVYGCDFGIGDYGKYEGGLIVCMFKSKGVVYVIDDYYLVDGLKDNGCKESYYSLVVKVVNLMYFCLVSGGFMRCIVIEVGVIYVLVFDENFSDNVGVYNVGLMVICLECLIGISLDEIYNNLMGVVLLSSISG